ncbi:MAG: hypothetical protein HDQ91_01960 [Desulfovibrio sp.]|nr:hypothetical protein [Desulfovibrio sp.]
MDNLPCNDSDSVLAALDRQIANYREQLSHLESVRSLYLKKANSWAMTADSMACATAQGNSGLTVQMLNEVLDTWPIGNSFSPEDLFRKVVETRNPVVPNKRNASALLSSFLSRKVRDHQLEKIERGLYRKPEAEKQPEEE